MASVEEDWEGWVDDEVPVYVCPVSGKQFPSAEEAFANCASSHKLDILGLQVAHGLDQYGCMKLINFVRAAVRLNPTLSEAAVFPLPPLNEILEGDKYLVPVLADDRLLQFDFEPESDWETEGAPEGEGDLPPLVDAVETSAAPTGVPATLEEATARCGELEQQLAQLRATFAEYRKTAEADMLGGMRAEDLRREAAEEDRARARRRRERGCESESSGSESEEEGDRMGDEFANLDSYFMSYSHYGIHLEMLKDRVRTESYRDFMYKNKSLFQDKIVLDVGCGTGILSMFAAKAGAKHVYAIDNSAIITNARDIVLQNGLDDKVTLIHGKVEEVDLPVDKVDIIISEWMGYFLLFESMLDTVLFARDKWLAEGGVVHPDQTSMWLAAVDVTGGWEYNIAFWDDVYDFKMTCMKKPVLQEACVTVLDPKTLMSAPCALMEADAMKINVKELEFKTPFNLVISRTERCGGLVAYFDVLFEAGCENPIMFSTSPEATPTHWKQTLFHLREPLDVKKGDIVEGVITCKRSKRNERALHVLIEYQVRSIENGLGEKRSQRYRV